MDSRAGNPIERVRAARAAFLRDCERLDPQSTRSAIQLDLDGIVAITDRLGSAAAEAVVAVVADRIQSECPNAAVVRRIGDDEFGVVYCAEGSENALIEQSAETAKRILLAIREPIVVAGRPIELTASVGLAVAGSSVTTLELVTWADAAMHDARAGGGNQIRRYRVSLEDREDPAG